MREFSVEGGGRFGIGGRGEKEKRARERRVKKSWMGGLVRWLGQGLGLDGKGKGRGRSLCRTEGTQ